MEMREPACAQQKFLLLASVAGNVVRSLFKE
jgi:hypothetical protein